MGKRLHRFNGDDLINKNAQFLNLEGSVVLYSGSTYCGIIESISDEYCFLKDHRGIIISLPKDQIFEIITDEISSY